MVYKQLLSLNPLSLSAALTLAMAGTASFLPAADAAFFQFSYTLENTSVLSGIMEGDIQPDGNTVFVSAVINPMFDDQPGPPLPYLKSINEFTYPTMPTPPTVSFDGMKMDLCATIGPNCSGNDGFWFDTVVQNYGSKVYAGGTSYGDVREEYHADNWKLVQVPEPLVQVPEPSAILGLVAVSIIGVVSRIKHQ